MARLFDTAIKTLAKVYSGDMATELTVEYDGGPSYDVVDHIMHLPYQIGDDVTPEVEDEFRVFLGHESYERKWRKLSPKMWEACNKDPCLKMWFNATGDVALEEEMSEEYPGLGLLAGRKNAQIGKDVTQSIKENDKNIEMTHNVVAAYATLLGTESITLDECLSELPDRWHPYIKSADEIISKRTGTSIEEAFGLAQTCRKKMDLVWKDEEEPPPGPGGDEEGEGGEGEDEVDGPGGLPFDDDDGDPLQSKRVKDLEEALDDMIGSKPGGKKMAGGKWRTAGSVSVYTFSSDYDVYCTPAEIWTGYYCDHKLDIAAHSQVFVTKLRQALTVPVPKYIQRRTKGSLDERAIHKLCMGMDDVFRRKLPQPDVSAAAVLSLDLSGSVGWAISTLAHVCGVWNDSFGKLDIPLEIQGWTTGGGTKALTTVGGHCLTGYDRYRAINQMNTPLYRKEAINFISVKKFSQKYNDKDVLDNIEKLEVVGSTPTGEGLLWAVRELIRRPERRKLLFFFTDGSPGFACDGLNSVHRNFIKTIGAIAERSGIEIYPIGLGYDIEQHFTNIKVPQSAKITEIESLLPILDGWVVKAFRDMANASVQHRVY